MKSVTIARALALLWAGFWTFFFVAEARAWNSPGRVAALWAGIGILFLFAAAVPWAWERCGGILLTALGLLVGVVYPVWAPAQLSLVSRASTTLMLCGPPIAAGAIFLMHRRALVTRA